MLRFKWLKEKLRRRSFDEAEEDSAMADDDHQKDKDEPITIINTDEWETPGNTQLKFVYFTLMTSDKDIIDHLIESERDIQTFRNEQACVEYIKSINSKVFLIIDGEQSASLTDSIQSIKHIDSVFFHSLSTDTITTICQKQYTYNLYFCKDVSMLLRVISKSIQDIERQISMNCRYNKTEKAMYNLSKEQGPFLILQSFKILFKNMSINSEDISMITNQFTNYYRRNLTELANIDEFKQTYRSADAIAWYTRETFLNKLLNKTIRMQNYDLLYFFRFYITDLSDQIELEFHELKKKQRNVLKLYRAVQLTPTELIEYQNSIGNTISNNEYLLTSGEYSIALDSLTTQEGAVRTVIEYTVDLNTVHNTFVADIQRYSAFPEQKQFLIDIGGLFQTDSCEHNAGDNLWLIKVHAADQVDDTVVEYIEYRQKMASKSNTLLALCDLFIDTGEYSQAERCFDYIRHSSSSSDDEIIWTIYNFGRIHWLRGDFNRAIDCYNRVYELSTNARSKELKANAGKAVDGLGVIFLEQDRELQAEECFHRAMELYKKSLPEYHVDIAETLVNLGAIDCKRGNFEQAVKRFKQASEIYDRSLLPRLNSNRTLLRNHFGHVYFAKGDDQKAVEEYEAALKLQEASLPSNHPYIAQTLENLARVHVRQKNLDEAKICLKRAEESAREYLKVNHPLMISINQTKQLLLDEEQYSTYL